MNTLFICSKNKLRSPTAEQIFSDLENISVRSAGINNDAEYRLGVDDIEWADTIFVMEKTHLDKLRRKFKAHLKNQKVIVLGIPDDYEFMDPILIDILNKKVSRYITLQ